MDTITLRKSRLNAFLSKLNKETVYLAGYKILSYYLRVVNAGVVNSKKWEVDSFLFTTTVCLLDYKWIFFNAKQSK